MNLGAIDLVIITVAAIIFLAPLLMGYFGYGYPDNRNSLLKKALIGIALLQISVLCYFGWIFIVESTRHVNHLKWFAPLIFVDMLMWVCFGIGFGAAALRYHFRTRKRP